MADRHRRDDKDDLEDRVVAINRCSKVVKGGRNFSFSALVVVGDRAGKVGFALGRANEVADAIRKGTESARRALVQIPLRGNTLPHAQKAKFSGAHVMLRPASPGTGMIAGGGMRAVLDLAGVHDVLAKSLGSNNQINVVKATMAALQNMQSYKHVVEKRGVKI
ncbi:MAG TPA: 30S ribosomal protein S5 [Lentisphaeria bacterium]|jgi:small subunit ribosomal protein S5|nr:30S ribosomal protein S5 [Lentisphaeria bacterium]